MANFTDPLEPAKPIAANFIDLKQWEECPPERQWVAEPLIPLGAVTALYGDGGSGKSMMALSLMTAMAGGKLWLGFPVVQAASVGLFAEDDENELVRRLKRLAEATESSWETVAAHVSVMPGIGIETIVASGEKTEPCITSLMERLVEKVKATAAKLLVLDYAAAIFAGDELDRSQVSAFMRLLNQLARDCDIAILLLGHPSAEGMRGGRGTSGSTAWRNQSRSFLHLVPSKPLADGRSTLVLTLTKANYAPSGRAIKLGYDGATFEVLSQGVNVNPGRKLAPAHKIALDALNNALEHRGEEVTTLGSEGRKVAINAWRSAAYAKGISPTGSPESNKKAFQSARVALADANLVGFDGKYAWLTAGEG